MLCGKDCNPCSRLVLFACRHGAQSPALLWGSADSAFKKFLLSASGSILALLEFKEVGLEKQLPLLSCGGETGPAEEKVWSGSTHTECDVVKGTLSSL